MAEFAQQKQTFAHDLELLKNITQKKKGLINSAELKI
jgi:hypothetical protein